jgi:ATP-dependent DNA helicase DinG
VEIPTKSSGTISWAPEADRLPSAEKLQRLGLGSFTAIDVETTGLDPDTEQIIEWGAARFVDGQLESTFQRLINPGKRLPTEITALTGITDRDLIDTPSFAEVYQEFVQFWMPGVVVGHNVDFDLDFLKSSSKRLLLAKPSALFSGKMSFDTAQLARVLWYSETGYGLSSLVRSRKIKRQRAHRALEDATATGWLFLMLVKEALELDFQTVATFLRFLEGSPHPLARFFSKVGNILAGQEMTKPITALAGISISKEEPEEEQRARQAPAWGEKDFQRIFSQGGELSKVFTGFEERQQQVRMATAVHRAFRENRFLSVEAGTGTGKSLAYLAPALAWAAGKPMERRRVIVSTGTKNLQEQLYYKDLPDLKRALPFQFRTALLKGRSNYICMNRWKGVLADPGFRLTPEERVAALPVVRWITGTQTGDMSEVNSLQGTVSYYLKSKLGSDGGMCQGNACKENRNCFLQQARRRAQKAQVVVVNHALLFSDVSNEGSVLGDYDRLIVDEAHRLEKAAVSHLGIEWSMLTLHRPLNRLYQGGRAERGILTQLKQALGKPKDTILIELSHATQSAIVKTDELDNAGRQFARDFVKQVEPDNLQTPDFPTKKRYRRGERPWNRLTDLQDEVGKCYQNLIEVLGKLLEFRDKVKDQFPFYNEEMAGEIKSAREELVQDRENFLFLCSSDDTNWVTWYEVGGAKENRWLKLQAAPLDVSGLINEALWKRLHTGILTSATLAVGESFEHLLKTVGLNLVPMEKVETLLLDSPFQLDNQMVIMVPSYFPSPKDDKNYVAEVSRLMEEIAMTKRGTLVLFTSYQTLNEVAQNIKPKVEQEGIALLVQGKDGAPEHLLRRFREDRSSILFGTDSFWEGIDVVGEALEILIVTRLPFDVPTDPWIQARSEQIESQGGNAFRDFSLPEAVIRLRQGVGRLIRTRKDRGVVMVTDSRMVNTQFGQTFVKALPTATKTMKDPKQMMAMFNQFWRI